MIEAVLETIGQPSSLVAEAALSEAKQQLRSQTEEAASRGIFGAPTFVVDGEIFWGNDRLESALSWAQSAGQTRAV